MYQKIKKSATQKLGYAAMLAAVLFIAGAVNAQSKIKVAVYVTGDANSGTKKVIGAKLVSAITEDDNYAAVERTADFLAALGKEQNYQASGAVDDNQIVALGKQFGVRFVCVADISTVYGSTFVSARMINVETALVTATTDGSKEINGMEDLTVLANYIANGLLNNVKGTLCDKKGKHVDNKGCCEGLVVINGICTDLNEYIQLKCGLEIRLNKSNSEDCPNGWRYPTVNDLQALSNIHEALSIIIPIRTYRVIGASWNDQSTANLPSRYDSYLHPRKIGLIGFYAVDLETGAVNKVWLFCAVAPSLYFAL